MSFFSKKSNPLFATSIFSLFFLLFISCEKEITVDLPTPEPKLAVEGFIEAGQVPLIILTKNASYFAPFDYAALNASFVHDADVTVSDGMRTVTLVEYCCSSLPDTIKALLLHQLGYNTSQCPFDICIYTVNFLDPSQQIMGEVGKTYTLNATSNDLHVSATTFMNEAVPMDSIWTDFHASTTNDSLVKMMTRLSDPDTIGNFYIYYTSRNSEPFVYGGVFDDKFINGKTFDSPIFRAQGRGEDIDPARYGFFLLGDTMKLKWATIDYSTYKFYTSLDYELGSQGSIFASPTLIQSNITDGLGIWAAINPSFHEAIAQP